MIYAVYLMNIPFLSESFYWMTGMIENLIGIFLSIIFFVHLNRRMNATSSEHKIIRDVLILVLSFIIPGFHEMFGIVFYIILVGAISIYIIVKYKNVVFLMEIAFCSTLGILFVVLSPGNFSRLGAISNTSILDKISNTVFSNALSMMLENLKAWVFSPTLIIMTLIFILMASLPKQHGNISEKSTATWKIFFIGFYFLSIFFCFFFASATVGYIPKRTLSGIYTIFFIGWVGIVWMLLSRLRIFAALGQQLIISMLILMLFFSSFHQRNLVWAIEDLQKGWKYHRQMLDRYKTIDHFISNGIYDVLLEDEMTWPRLFPAHLEVREDHNDMHWALYFRANSLSRKPGYKNIFEIDSSGFLTPRGVKFGFSKHVEFKIDFKGNIKERYMLKIEGKALRKDDQKIKVFLNGSAIGSHVFSNSSYENLRKFDAISVGPCSFHWGENILSVQAEDSSRNTKTDRNLFFVFGNISISRHVSRHNIFLKNAQKAQN